jgi:hypothetical protein
LANFACSAHARKIDISSVLVFATDPETKEIAEGLGLTAYYDERVRGKKQMLSGRVFRHCFALIGHLFTPWCVCSYIFFLVFFLL